MKNYLIKRILSIFFFMLLLLVPCYYPYICNSSALPQLNKEEGHTPIWEEGMEWTYAIDDIDLELDESDIYWNFLASFTPLRLKVTNVSDQYYKLSVDTSIKVDYYWDSQFYKWSLNTGRFFKHKITGEITLNKTDLSIASSILTMKGMIILRFSKPIKITYFPIPYTVTEAVEYDGPLHLLLNYPLDLNNSWWPFFSSSTHHYDGEFSSFWFHPMKIIMKIALLFNIIPEYFASTITVILSFLPVVDIGDLLDMFGMGEFYVPYMFPWMTCDNISTIDVEAGSFTGYNISIYLEKNEGYVIYSPDVGNIVKLHIQENSQLFSIYYTYNKKIGLELISYKINAKNTG